MARGNNPNKELYKKLHEEFNLEVDSDFYLHPQSGSYIIKHNAVKKIVAMQTEKGFVIQTPTTNEIKIISDKVGPHGWEIVVAGDFVLKAADGKWLRTVSGVGEANEKNCRLAFRHTMARKRMYDRGVLDLLQIAQLGGYSDVEADDFAKAAPKAKPAPKQEPAPTPEPPSPKQEAAPASRPAPPNIPKIGPPKKNPEVKPPSENDGFLDKLISLMEKYPSEDSRGYTIHQLKTLVTSKGGSEHDVQDALQEGIKIGVLSKSGEKRGTRYTIAGNANALTEDEYRVLWRDASEELRAKGIEYHDLMEVVNQVTGHDTAIRAFNNGAMTKESIAEIKRLGMLKVA